MTLTVNHHCISSDHTSHAAWRVSGQDRGWEVSWLPGQLLDRNTAITAMVLADWATSSGRPGPEDRLWPHISAWAGDIGLTASDAVHRVYQPPGGINAERDGPEQPDPEAAG